MASDDVPIAVCSSDELSDDSFLALAYASPPPRPQETNDKKRKAVDDIEEATKVSKAAEGPRPLSRQAEKDIKYTRGQLKLYRAGGKPKKRKLRNLVQDALNKNIKKQKSHQKRKRQKRKHKKRKHQKRKLLESAHGSPDDQSEESQGPNEECSKYTTNLKTLSKDKPTNEQISGLEHAKTVGPNYLGRTVSTTRGWAFGQYHRKTNGLTAHDVGLP